MFAVAYTCQVSEKSLFATALTIAQLESAQTSGSVQDKLKGASDVMLPWHGVNIMQANPMKFRYSLRIAILIGDNILNVQSCVKPLGVYIDRGLSFRLRPEDVWVH